MSIRCCISSSLYLQSRQSHRGKGTRKEVIKVNIERKGSQRKAKRSKIDLVNAAEYLRPLMGEYISRIDSTVMTSGRAGGLKIREPLKAD